MAFSPTQIQTIMFRLPDADNNITIRDAGHILWAFTWGTIYTKSIGGALTPMGALDTALSFLQLPLGGILGLTGGVVASSPKWLLIDEILTWMGEWDATYAYALDDVVLHKTDDGNEWHVFVSKITHNVGNVPTSSAEAWRRLYQEVFS